MKASWKPGDVQLSPRGSQNSASNRSLVVEPGNQGLRETGVQPFTHRNLIFPLNRSCLVVETLGLMRRTWIQNERRCAFWFPFASRDSLDCKLAPVLFWLPWKEAFTAPKPASVSLRGSRHPLGLPENDDMIWTAKLNRCYPFKAFGCCFGFRRNCLQEDI